MSGTKYKATVSVTFSIEFEDHGDLALEDQAYEEAIGRFNPNDVWQVEVIDIASSDTENMEKLPV